jgi:hypothetical protein
MAENLAQRPGGAGNPLGDRDGCFFVLTDLATDG